MNSAETGQRLNRSTGLTRKILHQADRFITVKELTMNSKIFPFLLLAGAIVCLLLSLDSFNGAKGFEIQRQQALNEVNKAYSKYFSPRWIVTHPTIESVYDVNKGMPYQKDDPKSDIAWINLDAIKVKDMSDINEIVEFVQKNELIVKSLMNLKWYRDTSLIFARILGCVAIIFFGLSGIFFYRKYRKGKMTPQGPTNSIE